MSHLEKEEKVEQQQQQLLQQQEETAEQLKTRNPISLLELSGEETESLAEIYPKVPSENKIPKKFDDTCEPENRFELTRKEISPHFLADGQVDWNMDESTPPLAAKTEEKVRGNAFKVSTLLLFRVTCP